MNIDIVFVYSFVKNFIFFADSSVNQSNMPAPSKLLMTSKIIVFDRKTQ